MRLTTLVLASIFASAAWGIDGDAFLELLQEARVEMEMPGLRAAVRDAEGVLVRGAVGLADVEADIPLDDVVGMPGGSTGKTFVAALTLLLVEDGTLSLDDHAARWLGEREWFQRLPNADAIRVRHLLAHTSGLGDYPATACFNRRMIWRVIRHRSARFEPEELIACAAGVRAKFLPGEGYRYTDAGYLVLGRLLEAASGREYYALLQERILTPLELDQVRPQDRTVLTGITPGYMAGARNMDSEGRMKFDPSSEWTGGGLITTPTMLVEFFAALAEARLLRRDTLQQMLEAGWRDPESPDVHYGFGVFVHDDGAAFGHGGLWPGYRTHVRHDLRSGLTIAVQTNRDGRLDLEGLIERIAMLAAAED